MIVCDNSLIPCESETGPEVVAYLGFGGNLGDRASHLRTGLRAIDAHDAVSVVKVSSVYETDYVGPGKQEPYLNACAEIRTTLQPLELLDFVHIVEASGGRESNTHMMPRPLDIDILLFGSLIFDDDTLCIPHPRMRERAFVLVPLAEIAAGQIFPDSRETASQLCEKITSVPGIGVAVRSDVCIW